MNLCRISACARTPTPSKSVMRYTARKHGEDEEKWKIRSFAAGADRDVIQKGADRLSLPLRDLPSDAIMGMREVADRIGLAGD